MVDQSTFIFLRSVLNKYLDSKYRAFIFGSRTLPKHRNFSDLDIGILGPSKIPASTLIQIKNELSDSEIPYLTDVIDFSTVSENFKSKAMANIISL